MNFLLFLRCKVECDVITPKECQSKDILLRVFHLRDKDCALGPTEVIREVLTGFPRKV